MDSQDLQNVSDVITWQTVLDLLTCKARSCNLFEIPDSDFVSACLAESKFRDSISSWLEQVFQNDNFKKSKEKSTYYRNEGNNRFQEKKYAESLSLYLSSVRYAPFDSSEFVLGLGNVSAALFHLEHYKKCLEIVDVAIRNGYPSQNLYKLHKRRGECFERLKNYSDASTHYKLAKLCIGSLNTVEFPAARKATLLKSIDAALARIDSGDQNLAEAPSVDRDETYKIPEPSYGESSDFVYASSALDLVYCEDKGRHVVTNRDVKQGDVLFVEKPYSFIVLPDHNDERCHQCFKPLLAPLPCKECVDVLYCCEKCRDDGWSYYHQWECCGASQLFSRIGIAHLGLRVLLKTGNLSTVKVKYENVKLNEGLVPGKIEKYGNKEDNYSAVYHLLPQLEKMTPEDRFQYAMTAALLTLYLKYYTSYFTSDVTNSEKSVHEEDNEAVSHEEMLFVGNLIHRHIAQLVCNAHAILELQTSETGSSSVLNVTQTRVGTAIYPSASMMNHSCDPNIFSSFFNEWLIVRASRDIPAGEEVFNCYGPYYRRMDVEERQQILQQQYFFTCKCDPCTKPKQYECQKRFSGLLCGKCSGPLIEECDENSPAEKGACKMSCMDCGHMELHSEFVEALFKAENAEKEGEMLLDKGQCTEARDKFLEAFHLRHQCMYKHNNQLLQVSDRLAYCYAMQGNYAESMKYLEISVSGIEEKYGSNSPELGNELQKLTDVMTQDIQCWSLESYKSEDKWNKVYDTLQRAKRILELNYGPWDSRLKDIMMKEKLLSDVKNMTYTAHFGNLAL